MYKHCHVAKALFAVASVDAIVIQTVLQYRYKQDFFGETVKQAKKKRNCLFKHSNDIMKVINVCKQSHGIFIFWFCVLHITQECHDGKTNGVSANKCLQG